MKSLLSLIVFFIAINASARTSHIQEYSFWESDFVSGEGQLDVRILPRSRCGDGSQIASVTHDRNSCILSELGLPGGCTRMGFHPVSGALKFIKSEDEYKGGLANLYQVSGTNYRIVTKFVGRSMIENVVRILVLNESGEVVDARSVRKNAELSRPFGTSQDTPTVRYMPRPRN